MKRYIIILLLLCGLPTCFYAQNFSLEIHAPKITADSIHLQAFDAKKEFQSILSVPNSDKIILKQKEKLTPGFYSVSFDSIGIFSILVSKEEKLNLIVDLSDDHDIVFRNSDENNRFIAYTKQMSEFAQRDAALNETFENAKNTMPQYMLQNVVENLIAQHDTIMREKRAYQQQVMADNRGTLLASIVQFDQDIPEPPQEYFRDRNLMLRYFVEHAFDNYPFADARMATVPATSFALKEFCARAYYLEPEEGAKYIAELVGKARANSVIYHTFFDHLEKVFGTLTSPYWTEEIYRAMLTDALGYDQLDPKRVEYYKTVLALHSKNLAGTQVPDFKIRWSDNSESTLYDIESEFILLYFQNPDCPTCTEIRGKLDKNEELNHAIESGRLKVVTIYFEQDEALWRRYLKEKANPKYLHGWEYENRIDKEQLYDIRIIPFMFLLDKNKTVIKKDIYYNEISDYINRIMQN